MKSNTYAVSLLSGVTLLLVLITSCASQFDDLEGTFTSHPGSFDVVLGENVTFYSTFSDKSSYIDVSWIVALANGSRYISSTPSEAKSILQLGIVFSDAENFLIVPARMDMNNTVVSRSATDGYVTAFSSHGNLKILGPPSPPEPVITAVNSTLLHVSWPLPFTWTNHSITHYNITLTNTANSNEDTTLHLHSNETSFPWSGAGGCDVLVVNVTASSDIGEGQVGQVIGGFPIPPAPFELMDCDTCKVTFTKYGNPMYAIKFKLPNVCSYQTASYQVWLYGPTTVGDKFELGPETAYTTNDTIQPFIIEADSILMLNHSYTIVVTVSNIAGSTSTNVTFSTDYQFPIFTPSGTVTTQATGGEATPMLIGVIMIALVVVAMVIVVSVVILLLYRRRRRRGAAELSLAKIFMEDGSRPLRGGPYTQSETRIYEAIDGYHPDTFAKLDTSPTYPPRGLPSLPPPRGEHLYHTEQSQVPHIVFESEKDNNAYLQLVANNKNKTDSDNRSTGSGEYTSMKSVSIKKQELENIAAVNRLAVQTAQGFNEDNYMVFMENGEQ